MLKTLSYLYPISKKIHSDINGTLEITWYNGKKQLNSANANYSYGKLQKVLEYGLEKLDLKSVESILVLGMGAGCVIESLRRRYRYSKHITAVEFDPVIIDIASKEFGIMSSDSLTIICDDAYHYMEKNTSRYDLIIIDLFLDTKMPSQFLKLPFWVTVTNALESQGSILFNATMTSEENDPLLELKRFLESHHMMVNIFTKVNEVNTLLISQRR